MNRLLVSAPFFFALLGARGSCARSTSGPELAGDWGGEHIGLVVSTRGATVEYDCAHGTIDEPLAPDGRGRFEARGTHTREHGGPVREGEAADTHPARYEGVVQGPAMALTVTLTDTVRAIGTYTLTCGDLPHVFKCL
ncbi:MAG: hypothetical protein WKG32_12350 [Gemmatimonadaceae bacterium]